MTFASFNALTFHGEGYLAMRNIRSVTPGAICVEAEVPSFAGMIDGQTDATALTTPAPLLDTLGQVTALFALQSRHNVGLFPTVIERIEFFAPPAQPGSRFTVLATCEQSDDTVRADLDFIDERGVLNYRVLKAEQRIFDWGPTFRRVVFSHGRSEPFAAISRIDEDLWWAKLDDIDSALLASSNGLWLEVVARSVLGKIERAAWAELASAAMARKTSWLLGRIAGKSALLAAVRERGESSSHGSPWDGDYADIAITNQASGAPQAHFTPPIAVDSTPTLSIAHCQGCAVALVSGSGQRVGIDVEPVDALADLGHLAKEIVGSTEAGALHTAGLLRLWCAKEAASKAAGSGLRGRPDVWLSSAWQMDDKGWTAEVAAPANVGGERYRVRLVESGGWLVAMAIARDDREARGLSPATLAARAAAGTEQPPEDLLIGV